MPARFGKKSGSAARMKTKRIVCAGLLRRMCAGRFRLRTGESAVRVAVAAGLTALAEAGESTVRASTTAAVRAGESTVRARAGEADAAARAGASTVGTS